MELVEALVIGNLIASFILFLLFCYCAIKIKYLELVTKTLKDPEKVFENLMKTRIPIIVGPNGQPMPLMPPAGGTPPKQPKNPLTG